LLLLSWPPLNNPDIVQLYMVDFVYYADQLSWPLPLLLSLRPIHSGSNTYQHQSSRVCPEEVELFSIFLDDQRSLFTSI